MPQTNEIRIRGLSDAEVASRVAAGKTNVGTDVTTKSIPQILAAHTFTLFNAVMVVLGGLVFLTGRFRNALFMLPVFFNLVIGVFQEIRSKQAIDKLSILAKSDVSVIRNGAEVQVPLEGIVLDDVVHLARGDQVPADAVVVQGIAALDESMLTGESVEVEKGEGDKLLSGSFLDSGELWARVEKVGADGYAARLNAEAKREVGIHSEIVDTLNAVIRLATVLIVPIGVGLYLRSTSAGTDTVTSILTTVSALVGLIPQGLILLTSSVFAIAATRLASKNVLVQQLYCTEALARVDTVCLDKTGTITSGHMEVVSTPAAEGVPKEEFDRALATLVAAEGSRPNETAAALIAYMEKTTAKPEEVARAIPFSSATKYSGCVTAQGDAYVMGAPQFVMGERFSEVEERVHSFGEMERVLIVARAFGFGEAGELLGDAKPLGFIAIRDEIRDTAEQTVGFFREQGVDLKVISGDDPRTVSQIAQHVGIPSAEHYVDATTLTTDESIREAAGRYHVFGRVTPEQKRELLRALKEQGHTVAMTGDGVNDVLALREADCSVAMASGSDAARNIAEIVLVDNDFAHMPEVVAQGRQSINNLERTASLFLVKTVFSALLSLLCIVWPPYPFLPVQMTLISATAIGFPSFFLALEPNNERVSGSFLPRVLSRSLPASFAILLGLVMVMSVSRVHGWSLDVESTLCMIVVAVVGAALIVRISKPLNPFRICVAAFVVGSFVIGCTLLGSIFEVAHLDTEMLSTAAVCAAVAVGAFMAGNRIVEQSSLGTGIVNGVARIMGGTHEQG